jgi:hypothetical protein
LIYVGQVYEIVTFLMRWKCTLCPRTFRHYPDGVYPYKRYLAVVVAGPCRRYLEEPHTSYREAVKYRGVPVAYALEGGKRNDGRQMAHSTLWRSLSFIATWWKGLRRKAERWGRCGTPDLACQKIEACKYRSAERRQTLIDAAKSLSLWSGSKYPTDFETLASGP